MSTFASLFKTKRKREKEHRILKYGARLLGEICCPINILSANEMREAMDGVYRCSRGASSIKYRATYKDHQVFIKCYSNDDYFFNEISTVVQLNHINVVKLLGCCFEMESPILIFELVPNNLHDLLHQANPQGLIEWENRLRIAIEIADVLTYLHTAKPRPIIHNNLSSSHILLDEHYRPKLCSFSLSVAIPLGEKLVKDVGVLVGKQGYVDQHYILSGEVTEKVDVFSFGLVLLELLTGKRPFQLLQNKADYELQKEAYYKQDEPVLPEWEEEKIFNIILDSCLWSMDGQKVEQFKAWIDVALRCLDNKPGQRPTMKEVVQQLRQIERDRPPLHFSSSCL